jgi:hypothetical protein
VIRPPKPASAVKALVEVHAQNWYTTETGWTEVDTVAHCGGDMGGDFIWRMTSVEIASGWTELRAELSTSPIARQSINRV